jgi:hypothetical protein
MGNSGRIKGVVTVTQYEARNNNDEPELQSKIHNIYSNALHRNKGHINKLNIISEIRGFI